MITRDQAVYARRNVSGVFDPEGMECAIAVVHRKFDSAVVFYNSGDRAVFRFDELTPSRELLNGTKA
jgi:hypothetical protein